MHHYFQELEALTWLQNGWDGKMSCIVKLTRLEAKF